MCLSPPLVFLKWEQAEKVEISYYILFSLLDEAFGVRQSFLECLQDSKVVFVKGSPLFRPEGRDGP